MTLKIAFYIAEHGNITDKIISILTLSKYSHCEIIFDDGEWASSSPRDGGVRFKVIEPDPTHWDIFTLSNWNSDVQQQSYYEKFARHWFILNLGKAYDWLGAIGSALNIDLSSKNKKFCSQVCAAVIGLEHTNITPGNLYLKLLELEIIKHG